MAIEDIFKVLDPDVKALRGEPRRNLVRNLLGNVEFADLNQTQAKKIFRRAGLGIRDSTFGRMFNEIAALRPRRTDFNLFDSGVIPSDEMFDLATFELPTRYRYIAEYAFVDDEGRTQRGFMTLGDDRQRDIPSIFDEIDERSKDEEINTPPVPIISVQISRAFINPNRPLLT